MSRQYDPTQVGQQAVVIGDTIWIRAARNIRRGEELTYYYSTDGDGNIQCRCRPGCKTRF